MVKILLSLLLFFFVAVPPVSAQSTDWVINNFDSSININQDGTVLVAETIIVDFKNLSKHGIYRDIPITYQDANREKTYTKIAINTILQDGTKAQTDIENNGSNIRIRIGDPDKTISGKHTYRLAYIATGVLRGFDTYDEFYWNVTGNDWEADIQHASATVTLPKGKTERTTCFEGYTGYTNLCSITEKSPTTVSFTATRNLPPTQGLTIVVGYTKGMVPLLTVPPPKQISDDFTNPLTPLAFLLTFLGGIIAVVIVWMKNGRDFWYRTRQLLDPNAQPEIKPFGAHEAVVVEFEAPDKLRPAELGVLMDEKADTLDITATIIDLANRGFLTIKELEKKWIFGSIDYELHRTDKTDEGLLPYEQLLLNRLFATGDIVKTSSLKTTFYDDLADVKKKLYEEVMKKKLFIAHPETIRNRYRGIGFGLLIVGCLCIFGAFPLASGILLAGGIGLVLSSIAWMSMATYMPRRTAYGREIYQRVKGYQLFIRGAEQYRQQFYEKKNMFNEILPYTIVFGLTGKFAQAMKEMGLKQKQPTWYTGTHVFAPMVFANDVNSFSKSLSTAIASTPSSSGGFSGGSSGGGFGGGGGGSW